MPQVALAFVGGSMMASAGYGAMGVMIGQAVGGGLGSSFQGGDFWEGAKGGAIGGLVGMGMGALGVNSMLNDTLGADWGGIASSALRGGVTGAASGGDFLQGALVGGAMQGVMQMGNTPSAAQSWGGSTAAPGSEIGWGQTQDPSGLTFENNDLGSWDSSIMPTNTANPMSFGLAGQTGAMPVENAGFANALTNDYSIAPQTGGMSLGTGGTSLGSSTPMLQMQAQPQGNVLSNAFGKLTDAFKTMATGGGQGAPDMKAALLSTGANLYMNQKNMEEAKRLQAQSDPYAQYRKGDAQQLNALMQDPSSIYKDPGYLAAQRQGQQALMRQGAAMGKVDSGQLSQGLFDQGSSLATQWYNNRINQLGGTSGAMQGATSGTNAYANARNTGYLQNALYNPGLLYGRG